MTIRSLARFALSAAALGLCIPLAALAARRSQRLCLLVTEEAAGTLAIVSPEGHVLAHIPLGERPHEVEVSADRRTAFVSLFGITDYDSRIGTPGSVVASVDLLRAARAGDYRLPADVRAPHGVRLRPPAMRELFVNAEVGGATMLVFDRIRHRLVRRFPLPPDTHNFLFSADGAVLFAFAGAKGIAKLDARTGHLLATRDLGAPVRGLALTAGGAVLAGAKGFVAMLRASDLAEIRRLPAPGDGQFGYLATLPDGAIAAPSFDRDGVLWWSADGSPARLVATGKTPIRATLGPDGLVYVANVNDDHVGLLGPDAIPRRSIAGLASPNGLAFGRCPR